MNTSEKRYELWTTYPAGDDRNPNLGGFDSMSDLIAFARMLPQTSAVEIHDNKLGTIQPGDHYKELFQSGNEPIGPDN